MDVKELLSYLRWHKDELIQSIYAGKYLPNPVRRVEIPKSNGKTRGLGIPTVVDRIIQQAISQVLQPLYEPQFSPSSYGFRPHRSAHDALLKCGEYISGGYVFFAVRCIGVWLHSLRYTKHYLMSDYCVSVIRPLRCTIIPCSKVN